MQARADGTPPLWLTVPARPGQLPGLRRALREWMEQAGLGPHDATSAQVAVGEATTNVVEHAYRGGEPGLVRLVARVDGDVLHIDVLDTGRWREASGHNPDRGRGFELMRATMDAVDVTRGDGGTTVTMRLTLGADA